MSITTVFSWKTIKADFKSKRTFPELEFRYVLLELFCRNKRWLHELTPLTVDSRVAISTGTLVFVRSCVAACSSIQTGLMSTTVVQI